MWRIDGAAQFQAAPMLDDGLHDDGDAGDGVYAAILAPQPNLTVIEFYVQAGDAGGRQRTWPAPTADGRQVTNALYQVFNGIDLSAPRQPGTPPVYFQIMTGAERDEFTQHRPSFSDAQFNATFIAVTGSRRGRALQRGRAHPRQRQSQRCRAAQPDQPARRIVPGRMSRRSMSTTAPRSVRSPVVPCFGWPVSTSVTRTPCGCTAMAPTVSMAASTCTPRSLNSEFADNHFPLDPNGNIYRGRRRGRVTARGPRCRTGLLGQQPGRLRQLHQEHEFQRSRLV